jgi:hypothetical protein
MNNLKASTKVLLPNCMPNDIRETSPIPYGSGEEPDGYAEKGFREIIHPDSVRKEP